MKTCFIKTRKRLAAKLHNPRLKRISFHTFRHWKATDLYHKKGDIYYVKQFLGHKCIKNTEIYINIERTLFESSNDDFTVSQMPNLNHFLQTAATGAPAEYGSIEETLAPAALDLVTEWILARSGEAEREAP